MKTGTSLREERAKKCSRNWPVKDLVQRQKNFPGCERQMSVINMIGRSGRTTSMTLLCWTGNKKVGRVKGAVEDKMIRFRFSDRVNKIEHRSSPVNWRKGGEHDTRDDGYWLHLASSGESIYIGHEKPPFDMNGRRARVIIEVDEL